MKKISSLWSYSKILVLNWKLSWSMSKFINKLEFHDQLPRRWLSFLLQFQKTGDGKKKKQKADVFFFLVYGKCFLVYGFFLVYGKFLKWSTAILEGNMNPTSNLNFVYNETAYSYLSMNAFLN